MPHLRPSKSLLKRKADALWGREIRARGVCEAADVSSCAGGFNAAHIISRIFNATRHEPKNGLCLCIKHHFWFDHERFEAVDWFRGKYPGLYEELDKKRKASSKPG